MLAIFLKQQTETNLILAEHEYSTTGSNFYICRQNITVLDAFSIRTTITTATMAYLPSSQAFLEQSCLLLEAYPDTTRITTKYSFPTAKSQEKRSSSKSNTKSETQLQNESPDTTQQQQQQPQPQQSVATLTLKTFNPATGICLKYRTDKIAEVGRLITGLGKLAGGANIAELGLSGAGAGASAAPTPAVAAAAAATAGSTADVDMVDAPAVQEEGGAAPAAAVAAATAATASAGGKGGKSKKKGGKGKR